MTQRNRFRVKQIRNAFVVWDHLNDKPVTLAFAVRSQAEAFAKKFVGVLPEAEPESEDALGMSADDLNECRLDQEDEAEKRETEQHAQHLIAMHGGDVNFTLRNLLSPNGDRTNYEAHSIPEAVVNRVRQLASEPESEMERRR